MAWGATGADSAAPATSAALPVSTSAARAPSAAPPTVPPPLVTAAPDPGPRGSLELVSTRPEGGPVSVRDSQGEAVATVQLQAGGRVQLELPPGEYTIDDTARGGRITLSVEPDRRARFELAAAGARGSAGEPLVAPTPSAALAPRRWKRVGAPLLSAWMTPVNIIGGALLRAISQFVLPSQFTLGM